MANTNKSFSTTTEFMQLGTALAATFLHYPIIQSGHSIMNEVSFQNALTSLGFVLTKQFPDSTAGLLGTCEMRADKCVTFGKHPT
jgi:hypothetical protein